VLRVPYQTCLMKPAVRILSLGAFAFYLIWNARWIAKGRVPPSILKFFTGIPCPTTGGTRSLLALLHGDWQLSLRFNPFLLVYLFLVVYSVAVLLRQLLRHERLALRPAVAWTWCVALTLGWIAKFLLGPKYW